MITNTRTKMLGKVAMVLTLLAALLPMERVEGGTVRSTYFINTPHNQTVTQGERVVLGCEVAPRSSTTSCSWTKSGSELSLDSRHWLEGCSLVIDPVQGSDEGSYVCLVKTSTSQMESRPASLEVLVEPGVPSILEAREGDWVEVDQGEELLLTCESQGGRPHAELQWRDAEGQRVFGHVQEHITRIGASSTFKTVSTLRFNPLHPMAVTCTAHSEAFTKVASSRPLTVQLRRKVEEEEVKLREGGSVRLQLPENKGPYKWLLNDREVPGETGNFLDIEDFTTDYHNSVVKCIQEKFGGEARLLKVVRLIEDNSLTLNTKEDENEDLDIQDDQPAVAGDQKMKKRLFTCVSDSEDANAGSPKYVWLEGRLETRVTSAKDEKGRTYKCTLLPVGLKKVKQIEKKLKVMSKDLKRFSRTLRKFTAPVSDVT